MHEYDIALKLLLEGPAESIVCELTDSPHVKWVNVELPQVQNPRVDLLGETPGGGLVHIEFQSTNDSLMALRMAEYCLQVYRRRGQFPRQIVLYVGNGPLNMKSELTGPDQSFRYKLVDIRDLDGERLLDSHCVGDNVIAILTRLDDKKGAVRRILDAIVQAEPERRDAALGQLTTLSGLRQLEGLIEREASKMPILNDILDHAVLGREYKRGLREGLQEGLQEGKQEGELKGQRALLRRLLEKRFGALPGWAEQQLATRSTAELEELGLRVLEAASLEEVLN